MNLEEILIFLDKKDIYVDKLKTNLKKKLEFFLEDHLLATSVSAITLYSATYFAALNDKLSIQSPLEAMAVLIGMPTGGTLIYHGIIKARNYYRKKSGDYILRKREDIEEEIPKKRQIKFNPIKGVSAGIQILLDPNSKKPNSFWHSLLNIDNSAPLDDYNEFRYYYSLNKYEQAYLSLKKILDSPDFTYGKYCIWNIHGSRISDEILKDETKLFFKPNNPDLLFKLAVNNFMGSDYKGVISAFKRLSKLRLSPSETIVNAMLLEKMFDELNDDVYKSWADLKDKLWSNSIDALLLNPKQDLKSIYGDNVFIMGPDKFISSTFVFKKSSDIKSLQCEMNLTNRVKSIMGDNSHLSVPKPIKIISKDNQYYYITQFQSGQNLADSDSPIKTYQEIASYLSVIHSKLPSSSQKRNYREICEKRIRESDFEFLMPLIEEWAFLFENLSDDYVFNKDPHGYNWIVHEKGITAIDFEDKGAIQREYEIAKLVETFPHAKKSINTRLNIIRAYANSTEIDENVLLNQSLRMALPVSLGMIMYGLKNGVFSKTYMRTLLDNSAGALELIQDPRAIKLIPYVTELKNRILEEERE